jgi:hypothetical protein
VSEGGVPVAPLTSVLDPIVPLPDIPLVSVPVPVVPLAPEPDPLVLLPDVPDVPVPETSLEPAPVALLPEVPPVVEAPVVPFAFVVLVVALVVVVFFVAFWSCLSPDGFASAEPPCARLSALHARTEQTDATAMDVRTRFMAHLPGRVDGWAALESVAAPLFTALSKRDAAVPRRR